MIHEHVMEVVIGVTSVGLISMVIGVGFLEAYFGFGIMEFLGIGVGIYFLFPVLFYFLPCLQKHLIFMNLFQWSFGYDFFEPVRHQISGARNFIIKSPQPGVEIGVWQILPRSRTQQKVPVGDKEWIAAMRECRKPIVIYFHGNTGNRASGHRLDLYRLLQSQDFQVITFDYRGFGNSTSPVPLSESGLVADSLCVYKWVLDSIAGEMASSSAGNNVGVPIFFWAHSLGTGVSVHLTFDLCSERKLPPPSGIILEAPFTNMTDAALSSIMSILYRPLPGWKSLISSKFKQNDIAFESDTRINKLTIPILTLHAKLDMVVPFSLGEKLHDIALKARPDDWEKIQFKAFDGKSRSSAHILIWEEPTLTNILTEFTSLCSPVTFTKR